MLVPHLGWVQSPDGRQGLDPLGKPGPRLSAFHPCDGGVDVFSEKRRAAEVVIEERPIADGLPVQSPRSSTSFGVSGGGDTMNLPKCPRSIREPADL